MNWNFIEAHWNQLKGKIKEEFGDLTDDDLMEIEGKREALVGKLQLRYQISREEAERRAAALKIDSEEVDDDDERNKSYDYRTEHPQADVQGEGNYDAAKRYQQEQHEFSEKMQKQGKLDH